MAKFLLSFIAILFFSIKAELLLNGVPFQFQLAGNVSYTPTSGGINIPGYILRIGYTKHQWIGVRFMDMTSNSNYDILIFRRSTVSNGGVYECTVSQYYASSGRPNTLMSDTINNMDKQVSTFSASNHFQLEMFRTKGNTNGEDWQGGQFTKICFFTSDNTFNKDNWQAQYQTCYGFLVNNYVSKWVGYEINSQATFDGIESKIYGGISGPILKMNLYFYRPSPTLNGSQITIKIGDKISNQVGYDFQKCLASKGDYFGNNTAQLYKDLIYSGYNDNQCSVTTTNNSITLQFSRFLDTHDDFDSIIGQNTKFCLIVGSSQNCHIISPKITFPQMNVQSAIKIYGTNLLWSFSLLILIFFLY